MSSWNAPQALKSLDDTLQEATLGLGELIERGTRSAKLDEALLLITSELLSWGLDDVKKFGRHINPLLVCWDILRRRDGDEAWSNRPGTSIAEVYKSAHEEYQNLLKILSHRGDADLGRGKAFCHILFDVALAASWEQICKRHGLAAA